MKIDLYHNIRWSRYKARVFSALYIQTLRTRPDVRFFQIADTDSQRTALSNVDMQYHQYPHELLFSGSYNAIPRVKIISTLFMRVLKSDADLVLIPLYSGPEHWAMLLASILRRNKRAVFCDSTLRDRPQSRIKGVFKWFFFKLCNGYFCYGVRAKEFLLHYGATEENIHFRCQAAALPDDYSIETAKTMRMEAAPAPSAPRLLYVGRLSPEKSLDVLIHAFLSVHALHPNAQLVLVGGGPDREALGELAINLGLGDAVQFTGSMGQEALAGEYARATCLVLPSRSEPWGLVVNEALHYGCPVVVSDACGCVPELVQDGVTGYAFHSGDIADLTQKIQGIIENFSSHSQISDHCLTAIAPYIPEAAAQQILDGCVCILDGEHA